MIKKTLPRSSEYILDYPYRCHIYAMHVQLICFIRAMPFTKISIRMPIGFQKLKSCLLPKKSQFSMKFHPFYVMKSNNEKSSYLLSTKLNSLISLLCWLQKYWIICNFLILRVEEKFQSLILIKHTTVGRVLHQKQFFIPNPQGSKVQISAAVLTLQSQI